MQVTQERFRYFGELDSRDGEGLRGKEQPVWFVSLLFCAILYIDYSWYQFGDAAPEPERRRQAQKNTEGLYQTLSADSVSDLTSLPILAIRSMRNIGYGEGCVRITVVHSTPLVNGEKKNSSFRVICVSC